MAITHASIKSGQVQNSTAVDFTFTPSSLGALTVQVTATDARGDTKSATLNASVISTGVCQVSAR